MNPRHPLHIVIRAVRGERLRGRDGWRAVKHGLLVTARRHAMRICHVSVQANHVHLVVEADDRDALARGMQGFQIACAKRFNRLRRRRGRLFSDRYHPVPLANPRQVRHTLAYVLNNWRKHRADDASHLRFDPYSSARAFDGWTSRPPPVHARDGDFVPVVCASVWLLTIGWRRHGAIAPAERPE